MNEENLKKNETLNNKDKEITQQQNEDSLIKIEDENEQLLQSNLKEKKNLSNIRKFKSFERDLHPIEYLNTYETIRKSKKYYDVYQPYLKFRILLTFLFLVGFLIISNNSSKIRKFLVFTGIKGFTFELAYNLKSFFTRHNAYKNFLIIFSSLSVDLITFFCFMFFILFSKSFRFIVSGVIYSLLLLLFQNIFKYIDPKTSIWSYPGFPSLIISYSKEDSYYYCGALGLLIICGSECWKNELKAMFYYSWIIIFSQAFILVVIRDIYMIDILTSIIISHYCFLFSDSFIEDSTIVKLDEDH